MNAAEQLQETSYLHFIGTLVLAGTWEQIPEEKRDHDLLRQFFNAGWDRAIAWSDAATSQG